MEIVLEAMPFFFFSSRIRHTRCLSDWSSHVCSSDLRASDYEPWRPRHRQYDRQYRPGRAGDHLDAVDKLCRSRELQDDVSENAAAPALHVFRDQPRSEERRVGKECRAPWTQNDRKKK